MSEFSDGEVIDRVLQGLTQSAEVVAVPNLDRGEVMQPLPQGLISGADPAIEATCGALVALQRRRVFCIKSQSRIDRSCEAYIRTLLGFRTDLPEAERKKISAEARRIKAMVEQLGDGHLNPAGNGPQNSAIPDCSTVVLASRESREVFDRIREGTEEEMSRLAKTLPAYSFIEAVKGVSSKTLAIIVGEAGNLSNYPDRSRLQKRLGIGVVDGVRQGSPGKNATADDWIRHGYNRRRRAEIWAMLDDVMFRAQWRGPKNGEAGYPIGPYGEHYARKKAEYVARGHPAPDRAARRYMAKMFLRDLWKAWGAVRRTIPQGQASFAAIRAPQRKLEPINIDELDL